MPQCRFTCLCRFCFCRLAPLERWQVEYSNGCKIDKHWPGGKRKYPFISVKPLALRHL